MNINSSVRQPIMHPLQAMGAPRKADETNPEFRDVSVLDQDKHTPTLSLGTKAGMALSAVGGGLVGYQYGGLLGGLVGLSAGSSVANDIAANKPGDLTAIVAGAAGVGAMAVGGHVAGFLGFFIGACCAAGAAKFVMQ